MKRTPEQHYRIKFIAICLALLFLFIAVMRWIMVGISQEFGLGFALGGLFVGCMAFALSHTLRDAD